MSFIFFVKGELILKEIIINIINNGTLLFILIQFVNVILSTFKSILTVNGGKISASLINSISYTFGSVITKLITKQSYEVVIVSTFLTNFIGVFIAKWLLEKREPIKLWMFQVTVKCNKFKEIERNLQKSNIKYTAMQALNNRVSISIYSCDKLESDIVKRIIKGEHYTVLENR